MCVQAVAGALHMHDSTVSDLIVLSGNLTGQRYKNEVRQPALMPLLRQHPALQTSQQVSACQHAAIYYSIQTLPWPAFSPIMSSSEHARDMLGCVHQRKLQPRTTA